VGISRTYLDANRSAVRALGAAHLCPVLGGSDRMSFAWTDGLELPVPVELPVE
jgi:hypothetical protein